MHHKLACGFLAAAVLCALLLSAGGQPAAGRPDYDLTITGVFEYQDARHSYYLPVNGAIVELWDACLPGDITCTKDTHLATTRTNAVGQFGITKESNLEPDGTRYDVYILLRADNSSAIVTDLAGNVHTFRSATYNNVANGTLNLGTIQLFPSQPFYIIETIGHKARNFLRDNTGWESPDPVSIRWEASVTTPTHYHLGGTIDLMGADGWDEDIFLHQYAHDVMYENYASFPTTTGCAWGMHSTAACAWTEGWAIFLQGAIQNHPDYNHYVDPIFNSNMEIPNPAADHDLDAGAVAAVLWDIYDLPGEGWDSLSDGMNGSSNDGIWKIFADSEPQTLQDFWNGWGQVRNLYCDKVWSIFNHAQINYDMTAPAAVSGISSPSHTPFVWSNDPTINMVWSAASDGCGSGVAGYSMEWSTSASTLPDATVDTTGTSATSPALADGNSWYFHIRAADLAGNWSPVAAHAGPFYINTSGPILHSIYLPTVIK